MSRQAVLLHLRKRKGAPRPPYWAHSAARELGLSEQVVEQVFHELIDEGLMLVSVEVSCEDGHLWTAGSFGSSLRAPPELPDHCEEPTCDWEEPCGAPQGEPRRVYTHSPKLQAIWAAEPAEPNRSPLMMELCDAAGLPLQDSWEALRKELRALATRASRSDPRCPGSVE